MSRESGETVTALTERARRMAYSAEEKELLSYVFFLFFFFEFRVVTVFFSSCYGEYEMLCVVCV